MMRGTNDNENAAGILKICSSCMYRRYFKLRRNPIENRAISSFSGQKSGTRIIVSILQSFLHLLKAKYINNCLK